MAFKNIEIIMENDYHYIPPEYLEGSKDDPTIFPNHSKDSEYWAPHEKIKCPYESEGEMLIDMVTYSMALLGVRYLLGDPIPPVSDEFRENAIGLAEAFGFYNRAENKVSLTGADIHSLYPQDVERRGGLQ